jgi:hypothetical protein
MRDVNVGMQIRGAEAELEDEVWIGRGPWAMI